MRQETATSDARAAEIAGRQHGVASAAQLAGAGLSPSAITRRVRSGRLHRPRTWRSQPTPGHPPAPVPLIDKDRQAFEDDHAPELDLQALGYRLRRFTDHQVRGQPGAVAAAVGSALRESACSPSGETKLNM